MATVNKRPWLKWYPSDWAGDPRLRMCSLAARGLWIEMINLMHEASPYGHLLVSGCAPTDAQLAVLAGGPPDQIPDLLRELETAGVFSRTRKGVIYSRRMTRDEKRSKYGQKTVNKRYEQDTEKPKEKPRPSSPPNRPASTPESIFQIPGVDTVVSTDIGHFDHFWEAYPRKVKKPDARKAFAKAIRKAPFEEIIHGLEAYIRSKPAYQDWAHPTSWLNGERWSDGDLADASKRRDAGEDRTRRRAGLAAAVARRMEGGGIGSGSP